jgi:ATP adenylyltransferase/5',5'''-P-1,P-4-tetraphosphate phosphorylase II
MTDFQPGTLWQRVVETSRLALRDGALRPIATSFQFLEDGGVRFLVRVVEHLRDKPRSEGAPSHPMAARAIRSCRTMRPCSSPMSAPNTCAC